MIEKVIQGDIQQTSLTRLLFAINKEGINDAGLAGAIAHNHWTELTFIGPTQLGTLLSHESDGKTFYAVCCHSLEDGWGDAAGFVGQALEQIPGDEPIAAVLMGSGLIGMLGGADIQSIKRALDRSPKRVWIYYL